MTPFWRNRINDVLVGLVSMLVVFVAAFVLSNNPVWASIVGGSSLLSIVITSPVIRIITIKRANPKASL